MAGLIIVEENACSDPLLDIISCPQNCHNEYELIFQPSLSDLYTNRYQFHAIEFLFRRSFTNSSNKVQL